MVQKTLIFALLCTSLAVVSAAEDGLFGNIFKIPGMVFSAATNVGKNVVGNVIGGVGDVGQTVGDVVNEKIQLGSRSVNKVEKVFESVGNEVGNIFKDGDLSQIIGRSVGAAGNIIKSVASESMDGVKDVMSTGGRIIRRKFDLRRKLAERGSDVVASGVDQAAKIYVSVKPAVTSDPLDEI